MSVIAVCLALATGIGFKCGYQALVETYKAAVAGNATALLKADLDRVFTKYDDARDETYEESREEFLESVARLIADAAIVIAVLSMAFLKRLPPRVRSFLFPNATCDFLVRFVVVHVDLSKQLIADGDVEASTYTIAEAPLSELCHGQELLVKAVLRAKEDTVRRGREAAMAQKDPDTTVRLSDNSCIRFRTFFQSYLSSMCQQQWLALAAGSRKVRTKTFWALLTCDCDAEWDSVEALRVLLVAEETLVQLNLPQQQSIWETAASLGLQGSDKVCQLTVCNMASMFKERQTCLLEGTARGDDLTVVELAFWDNDL